MNLVVELLNLASETYNTFQTTDDNITQGVMEVKVVWEANTQAGSNKVDSASNLDQIGRYYS
jgi:hypothetical protein